MDPATADDVAQSTFLTFIETAHRFEGRSRVRTWIFGILYRKISETRRRGKREERPADFDSLFEQNFDAAGGWVRPPRPADTDLDAAEIRAELDRCFEMISDNQRMAFVLKEVDAMTSEEICKIMEVTRTNLGVLLHRARTGLRGCLEERDLEDEE